MTAGASQTTANFVWAIVLYILDIQIPRQLPLILGPKWLTLIAASDLNWLFAQDITNGMGGQLRDLHCFHLIFVAFGLRLRPLLSTSTHHVSSTHPLSILLLAVSASCNLSTSNNFSFSLVHQVRQPISEILTIITNTPFL